MKLPVTVLRHKKLKQKVFNTKSFTFTSNALLPILPPMQLPILFIVLKVAQ